MSMGERIALLRPLTGAMVHPEFEIISGSDVQSLNGPGDVTFSVAPEWYELEAGDGAPFLGRRQTLVVVERANGSIRAVGLVDDLNLTADALQVSCGGFSMILGQSGPWEGPQGRYLTKDALSLFRDVVAQAQKYDNANLGIRVVGDTRSGSSVGYAGSARWQNANRQVNRYKPELEKWESRVTARERELAQRQEKMFRAAGLKRVGTVTESEDGSNPPDDPGYQADSTLWIRKDQGELGRWGRAYRWRSGRWISQSQADNAVRRWRGYQSTVQQAKDEVERLQYLIAPAQELLEQYADEAREEYSLYFWQNHDLNSVIEDLCSIGPFEFREEAAWSGEALDLRLRAGAPRVGVRRDELHLELGSNVHELPELVHGELYTGVALFGAGEGSEVLSEQRAWNPAHAVRNILTETDKDAHTRALTRAAANRLRDQVRKDAEASFSGLAIVHDEACPEGSFLVGDELFITGRLAGGQLLNRWVRVLEASHEWGSNITTVEVESV